MREFFYKTVRQSVANFTAMTIAEKEALEAGASEEQLLEAARYDSQLEVLRALASTGPGNIRSAENVATSIAGALIRAAGERTVDLLQLHQSAVEAR